MQLARIYRTPGAMLLARNGKDEQRVGCVGLRSLDDVGLPGVGEVRRLFVRPDFRGERAGVQLAEAAIDAAGRAAMHRLVLNTLPQMTEAVALYERLGFTSCQSYLDEPTEGVLYYALDLTVGTDAG